MRSTEYIASRRNRDEKRSGREMYVSCKRVASMRFNKEPLTHTFGAADGESLPLPYVTHGF